MTKKKKIILCIAVAIVLIVSAGAVYLYCFPSQNVWIVTAGDVHYPSVDTTPYLGFHLPGNLGEQQLTFNETMGKYVADAQKQYPDGLVMNCHLTKVDSETALVDVTGTATLPDGTLKEIKDTLNFTIRLLDDYE